MRKAVGGRGVCHHVLGVGYFEFRPAQAGEGNLGVPNEVLFREIQEALEDLDSAWRAHLRVRAVDLGGCSDV